MYIIGSTALRHHYPDFPREPKDLDYLVNIKSMWTKEEGVEYLENDVLWNYLGDDKYVSPNLLYTLKMSHVIGWDINWDKHVFDIQFLKKKGCELNRELFYELYDYWNTIHKPNKRSDLDMTAEDFFDNALKSGYSHDWLHTLLNPFPTYNKVLIGEVEVGEDKFNSLSFEEKCNLVTEEVMVMAWERYRNIGFQHAYNRMLKKFIINHAPLWEAVFILENYIHLHKPKFNYYKTIENGIKANKRVVEECRLP